LELWFFFQLLTPMEEAMAAARMADATPLRARAMAGC
jgi:hypothetical protein